MTVTPQALAPDVMRDDLQHAVAHALSTVAIGNGPTRILVIGRDSAGRLIEATGVIRDEDMLFVHAALMREEYTALLERAAVQPGAATSIPAPAELDRWSVDGIELTENNIATVREKAVRGHDVEVLRRRLRPGRPAPLAIGDVVRVEFDAPLHSALSDDADARGVSVSAAARSRMDAYLTRTELHSAATKED